METSRRNFLKNLSFGIGSLGFFGLSSKTVQAKIEKKIKEVKHLPAAEVARDEDFWFHIQQAFNIDRSIINLNNGGVHP
ncbi:MAG: twin-arginine translocation signal domain-containing protein, partial [Candidatus Aminicenantes bacterium]|nr:twin-arginine translocation signal domain-containing protein [Candidatus Aminicenantes bacterium]